MLLTLVPDRDSAFLHKPLAGVPRPTQAMRTLLMVTYMMPSGGIKEYFTPLNAWREAYVNDAEINERCDSDGASVLDCWYVTRYQQVANLDYHVGSQTFRQPCARSPKWLCRIAILQNRVGSQTFRHHVPGHQNGCTVSPF